MKNAVKGAALAAVAVGVVAGGAGAAFASSTATGSAADSPGVGSGNLGQVPVHVPVNVSGVTGNVIGALNPAFGDTAANVG